MGKFDGILLCTDLDGTLLRDDKSISAENLRAIEYFKAEGGLFTIISGRLPYYSGDMLEAVKPNALVGFSNGGALFDAQKGEYIWRQVLPEKAKELMKMVEETFPHVGILVRGFHEAWYCRENEAMRHIRRKRSAKPCHYTQLPAPMAKVTFVHGQEQTIQALAAALAAHPLAGEFTFVRSEQTLYEINPKGITKGTAIEKLREHYGQTLRCTVAVGDYNNDVPMLQAADIAVAVANAVPETKAAADYITVSNEQHAIAQLIADLEKGTIL